MTHQHVNTADAADTRDKEGQRDDEDDDKSIVDSMITSVRRIGIGRCRAARMLAHRTVCRCGRGRGLSFSVLAPYHELNIIF